MTMMYRDGIWNGQSFDWYEMPPVSALNTIAEFYILLCTWFKQAWSHLVAGSIVLCRGRYRDDKLNMSVSQSELHNSAPDSNKTTMDP